MTCRACRVRLGELVDGRLTSDEASALEAHLAACPTCRAHLSQLRAAMALVDAEPRIEPSTGFDAAFARRLEAAKRGAAKETEARGAWFRSLRLPIFAFAVAACVAVASVAVLRYGRPVHRPPATRGAVSDLDVVRHVELLQNYDVVANLDVLEDLEVVQALDELGAGGRP
ncbi:MAG: zf-HC2 domain-containing protein [Deltaproteobacteria bacterium]|nr:zf-HC2 domain-containing protein [Deltaproteobacteria bacterium]